MCSIDDAPYPSVFRESFPVARKAHRCYECRRMIQKGEKYRYIFGVWEGTSDTMHICAHCQALAEWMVVLCGGHPYGDLYSELDEHWLGGYKSLQIARWMSQLKHGWFDGRAPVPEGVRIAAQAMLQSV